MKFYIIILVIAFIFLVPLPIFISFNYKNNKYNLKLWNITIISDEGGLIYKFLNKRSIKKYDLPKRNINEKTSSKKSFSIVLLIDKLTKNKFKPKIVVNINSHYSIGDACNTAIVYGVINMVTYSIRILFERFIKFKKYNCNIKPTYIDTFYFDIDGHCIIIINLSQIIIILLLTMSSKINREVTLNKG